MVPDGWASVHLMISQKVTIAGFDLNSYRDCLTKWNRAVETTYNQCMEMIGKARGLFLSKVERSTDQDIKPVIVGALSKWVGKIAPDVLQDMAVIASMLAKLEYDPYANPPNYGKPDPKILENTRSIYKGEFQLPDFLKEKSY
ncbi:Protein-tyrosine sulfotransferase 1 [Saguinus oedipus]|uniref:Protein-tyrosine sulfotransferase n=1 Tax=Saguinus oedipus TaxID=9490 RepID=A0ABQ9W3H1_SAGOE|nr:Protein-tyrosine sulfotransferase 1 [Saguinus oedipus]